MSTTKNSEQDTTSWQEWVHRARDGDREAFRQLVDFTQQKVYRVALRTVGSETDAEEATQETYIRAWQQLDNFQFRSSLVTWLCRIAINVSIDLLRKQKRDSSVLDQGDNERGVWVEQLPSADQGPEQQLEQAQLQQQIQEVLQSMKPNHRVVFALREIDGLSYEEIAEVVDCPPGTVESRLHRARQEFRDKLTRLQRRQ